MEVCGLFYKHSLSSFDEIDNILLLTCIIIFKVKMSKHLKKDKVLLCRMYINRKSI